jgi:HAD superfamily hydrolase (TIGR01450 family)
MLTTQSIFDRYEEVRARFPDVAPRTETLQIQSLLDIADQVDAFVFDAFGVLNVGETMIPGADRRLDQLRERGCNIRILTNAASYDRSGAIAKFKRLGLRVNDEEIITSREAALQHLGSWHWGVITADSDPLTDLPNHVTRLKDSPDDYDTVDQFLFLSTADWTVARQGLLMKAMQNRPRNVLIGNADLAAPRDDGFSVEPGHFGHQIADLFPNHVQFFGKPFPEVYDLIEATLPSLTPDRIAMCGDTLHTDILGAAARGWRTVLVTKDGLFAGYDTQPFSKQARLFADWRLSRI